MQFTSSVQIRKPGSRYYFSLAHVVRGRRNDLCGFADRTAWGISERIRKLDDLENDESGAKRDGTDESSRTKEKGEKKEVEERDIPERSANPSVLLFRGEALVRH